MADPNDPNVQPPEQPQQPVVMSALSPQRQLQQELAEVAAMVERLQPDESNYPGGRFLVNGVYVDANGERHKDQKSE